VEALSRRRIEHVRPARWHCHSAPPGMRIAHSPSQCNCNTYLHGPRLCEGLVTFQERETVNFESALLQWQCYVDIFRRHGWKIVEVDSADDCPDAVFVEAC
jgi:hypothetical protein